MTAYDIREHPIHLGLGATALVEPTFTGDEAWYEAYLHRHADDGMEGRVVAVHTFTASWDMWECHPNGAEVVLCLLGEMTLLQESPDGMVTKVTLQHGHYAINPPGVWHTADIEESATALFITAGVGTEHKARE